MRESLFIWPKHWGLFPSLLGLMWATVLTVALPTSAAGQLPTVFTRFPTVKGLDLELNFITEYNPTSLQIERATSLNGPWAALADLPGNATSYLDTDIVAGLQYCYRIRGFHADKAGRYSSPVAGMLQKANFFSERWILAVNSDGVVTIQPHYANWAGSMAVQRRTQGDVTWNEIMVTPPGSKELYIDSTAKPGVTYEYRFVTLPASKQGGVSPAFTREIPPYGVPGTPPNFAYVGSSENQISLSWLDAGYEQGYRLERRLLNESGWIQLATLPANTNAYTDTSVSSGSGYWYRLTAFNELGDGPAGVTTLTRARAVPVVIEDDFDPGVDGSQWTVQKGGTLSQPEVAGNTTRFVLLNQAGERSMETAAFDATGGGYIEFSCRRYVGSQLPSDEVNDLQVEGQIFGDLWVHLVTLYSGRYDESWTTVSIWLPGFLLDPKLKIRWRHEADDVEDAAWALDNVRICAMPDDTIRLVKQPVLKLVREGDAVTLKAATNRTTATFQWYKDGVAVQGATVKTYDVARTQAAHAGRYLCEIRYKDVVERTEPVTVVVVAMNGQAGLVKAAEGGGMELEVKVHPAEMAGELSYAWSTAAVGGFPAAGVVSGVDTSRLTVGGTTQAAEASYHCQVSLAPDLTVEVGPFQAVVVEPSVIAPVADQTVVAGQGVNLPLAVTGDAPVVTVEGLPKGLTYDAETGRITGSVAVGLAGRSYGVTVRAVNDAGAAEPVAFALSVVPFPVGLAGTYRGVFTETGSVFLHGGQVTVQISSRGAVSGAVMLKGKTLRFTQKQAEAGTDGTWLRVNAPFKGPGKEELLVRLNVNTAHEATEAHLVSIRTATPPADPAAVAQWPGRSYLNPNFIAGLGDDLPVDTTVPLALGYAVRNAWSVKNPAPGAGTINVRVGDQFHLISGSSQVSGGAMLVGAGVLGDSAAFALDSASAAALADVYPAGHGFLNLTLKPNGTVMVKGRLADGQVLTGSTILGTAGYMPVFVNLYRGTGSFGTLLRYAAGVAEGTGHWGKDDPGTRSKDRVFRGGFARHLRYLRGGLYARPAAGEPVPGLGGGGEVTEGPAAGAELTFSGGGLAEPLVLLGVDFTARHAPLLPRGPELNPNGVTLKLNAATGVFTGRFKLVDANPVRPAQRLTRTVTYHGALVPGEEGGHGYFLLPELPDAAVKGSSLGNTPQWSGQVRLEAEAMAVE